MGKHIKSLSIPVLFACQDLWERVSIPYAGTRHDEGLNAHRLKSHLKPFRGLQLLSKYFQSNILFPSEKETKGLVLILKWLLSGSG